MAGSLTMDETDAKSLRASISSALVKQPRGRKLTCECGTCRKCRGRASQRRRRAELG